jgi:hypothetical protein
LSRSFPPVGTIELAGRERCPIDHLFHLPRFFNLADEIKVGIAGSMANIPEAQLKAGKVITI